MRNKRHIFEKNPRLSRIIEPRCPQSAKGHLNMGSRISGWHIVPFLLTGRRRGMPAMRGLAMWHWAWGRARSSSRDKHIIIITCHVSHFNFQTLSIIWDQCKGWPLWGHLHNRNLGQPVCSYLYIDPSPWNMLESLPGLEHSTSPGMTLCEFNICCQYS